MKKNHLISAFLLTCLLLLTTCGLRPDTTERLKERALTQSEHLIDALNKGNLDSLLYYSQQNEQIFYYVFLEQTLVFWSRQELSMTDVPYLQFDTWMNYEFANATAQVRLVRAGMYRLMIVIPTEWHLQQADEVIGKSVSYSPLRKPSAPLHWYERLHIRARVFLIILLTISILLLLFVVVQLIRYRGLGNMRLYQKISYILVTFVAFSFTIVVLTTLRYQRHRYAEQQIKELQGKCHYVQSVLQNLYYYDYRLSAFNTDGMNADLRKLAVAYGTDIHVFDMYGRLVASSTPELFESGLLSHLMASSVYFGQQSTLTTYETLGDKRYLCAYTEFNNGSNMQIGYIAMPSFVSTEEMDREVDGFMEQLLPPYLTVMLLVLIISYLITRMVTAPLQAVSENLQRLEPGKENKHISYAHNDEVGELVRHYNHMVDVLDESTRSLAQREREEAWQTMARQIAHEVNNLLTPMKLCVQQMQRARGTDRFDELFAKGSSMLKEQIDTLSRIAVGFSSFAKMSKVQSGWVDVAAKLVQTISLHKYNDQSIPIRYIGPDYGVMAWADASRIGQVFTNILRNALQALDGQEGGDIIVQLEELDSEVRISFSDNGPGVPEEIRTKIFTPNFTTKSYGSGLGLAISKNIVEGFGGKICFETQEKGAKFFVSLKKKQ